MKFPGWTEEYSVYIRRVSSARRTETSAGRTRTAKSKASSHCRSRLAFSRWPNDTIGSQCQQAQKTRESARELAHVSIVLRQSLRDRVHGKALLQPIDAKSVPSR